MDSEYITARTLISIAPPRALAAAGNAVDDEDPTIESAAPAIPADVRSPLGDDEPKLPQDLVVTEVLEAAAAARSADDRRRWLLLGVWAFAATVVAAFSLVTSALGQG